MSEHVMVAVCQFAPGDSRAENRERVGTIVADAAARGAQLIVLPEYASFFTPSFDARLAQNAEPLDGPFVTALRDLAAAHGVTIVAGMVEQGAADRVRNAVVAVDGSGLLGVYRKLHLYDAFGSTESDWIEPGVIGDAVVFEVGGLRFGLLACYDLRFPEVARTLADAGADALVVPAEWVRGPLKENHWNTLLAARAIENTAYVLAADHPEPIGVGNSAVLDPQGVTIAAIGTGEGTALARLERDLVTRAREVNPALRLRRFRVTPLVDDEQSITR